MRSFIQRLALSLATGVIFVFWSELAFWARPYAGTSLAEMLPTTIAYSLAAYLFLAAVSAFRVRHAAGVFLAGALFGWFVEGVIVQTMVEDLPWSVSFTGLAWHATFTVLMGWWLIPRWLGEGRVARNLAILGGIGAAYGLWAMTWWVEAPPPTPPLDFGAYVLQTTAILAAAHLLSHRIRLERFAPSRLEWAVVGTLVFAYFAFVTVPMAPVSMVVLPPLVGLVVAGLWRMRPFDGGGPASAAHGASPPPVAYAALFALPIAATIVYALGFHLGPNVPTGVALYLITTPLGFALLGWSLWRAFSRRGLPSTAESARGA